jgi:hypothetical protein
MISAGSGGMRNLVDRVVLWHVVGQSSTRSRIETRYNLNCLFVADDLFDECRPRV